MKKLKPLDDADFGSHAWADESKRFPADIYLREHGWRILQRHGDREALWEFFGSVASVSEALKREKVEEVDGKIVKAVRLYEEEVTQ